MCPAKRCVGVLVAACVLMAAAPRPAEAWGPIAHWIIAELAGQNPRYANLPDAWSSTTYQVLVSDEFAWSHAAIDLGQMSDGSPSVPYYPDDGRYPGYTMYALMARKLGTALPRGYDTAKGFMCHNWADRAVHFDYFVGSSIEKWIQDHQFKEAWAEYVLFAKYKGGISFDPTGRMGDDSPIFRPVVPGYIQPDKVFVLGAEGNPQLIQLAQKVYRKNGRSVDSSDQRFSVHSVADIAEAILALDSAIAHSVALLRRQNAPQEDEANLSLLPHAKYAHWVELHARAMLRNWTVPSCIAKAEEARDGIKAWTQTVESEFGAP
jgi:hypothetical protein